MSIDETKGIIKDRIKPLEPKRARLVFTLNALSPDNKEILNLIAKCIDEIDGYTKHGNEIINSNPSEEELKAIEERHERLSDALAECDKQLAG